MGVSQITAAASVITLNGVEYRLSPFRDCDFGEFELWAQDHYLEIAKRNLDGLIEEPKESLLKYFNEYAGEFTISSFEVAEVKATTEGAAKLLYLSLRREHPNITQEEAARLCADPAVAKQCMNHVDKLNNSNSAIFTKTPLDRLEIYQALSQKYGWTPQQVSELTPYQQMAYLRTCSSQSIPVHSFTEANYIFERMKYETGRSGRGKKR